MDTNLLYLDEYTKFVTDYKKGFVSAEDVGELIARMAQYYSFYNGLLIAAERKLFIVARDIEMSTDQNSGKTITSTKAQAMINATDEYNKVNEYKMHVRNTEQFINALKFLQKGLLNEYAHQ